MHAFERLQFDYSDRVPIVTTADAVTVLALPTASATVIEYPTLVKAGLLGTVQVYLYVPDLEVAPSTDRKTVGLLFAGPMATMKLAGG